MKGNEELRINLASMLLSVEEGAELELDEEMAALSLDELRAAFQAEGLSVGHDAATARAKINARLAGDGATSGKPGDHHHNRINPSRVANDDAIRGTRLAALSEMDNGSHRDGLLKSGAAGRPIRPFETLDLPQGKIAFSDDGSRVLVHITAEVPASVLILGIDEYVLRPSESHAGWLIVDGLDCDDADEFLLRHSETPARFLVTWR